MKSSDSNHVILMNYNQREKKSMIIIKILSLRKKKSLHIIEKMLWDDTSVLNMQTEDNFFLKMKQGDVVDRKLQIVENSCFKYANRSSYEKK